MAAPRAEQHLQSVSLGSTLTGGTTVFTWEVKETIILMETGSSSLSEKAVDPYLMLAAFRRAVRAAVLEHARAGRSVPTMRDGKVVWIPPEEILALPPLDTDKITERNPPSSSR